MKIAVVAVGKLRDRHLTVLCDDYVARVRRHLPIEVVEVEDGGQLLRRRPAEADTVALDPGGEAWSTERFARYLEDRMTYGRRALAFLIGGADGLPSEVIQKANVRLSLSALTFPHRLARLVLLEQIYRAISIIRDEPYHH
jgi:23S rRNA (pseudouridine1915-N3)-methyltransferase